MYSWSSRNFCGRCGGVGCYYCPGSGSDQNGQAWERILKVLDTLPESAQKTIRRAAQDIKLANWERVEVYNEAIDSVSENDSLRRDLIKMRDTFNRRGGTDKKPEE